MESSLKNMVLVLFTITLLSSAAVGGVYLITKEPIAQAKEAAVNNALKQVLPEFEATTKQTIEVNALPIVAHTATVADKATLLRVSLKMVSEVLFALWWALTPRVIS